MNAAAATLFSPKGSLTRAQLITILYRIAGSSAVTQSPEFTDVPAGIWYSAPVVWAAEHQIVNGYPDGGFRPDGEITQEQIATILYRYSSSPKMEGSLEHFPDGDSVSNYAKDALLFMKRPSHHRNIS